MKHTNTIVIGGGIAGLYTARLLEKKGIDYQLFESKPVFGGRIAGVPTQTSQPESLQFYDLGPTWVFPHHPRIQTLVAKYGLTLFDQYDKGDVLYQFENIKMPRKIAGGKTQHMYRVDGGLYRLVRTMVGELNANNLHNNTKVKAITQHSEGWRVSTSTKTGTIKYTATNIVFALPPRVLARDFDDAPFMTRDLSQQLNRSQTWMSAQAKLLVTYKEPFWRQQGLSGQAFSQTGPLVEIYDACTTEDADIRAGYALFGFIGMAATLRQGESQKVIKQSCIRQLAAIYGHQAYRFEKCYLKDWARDKDICTGQDQSEGSRHPVFDIFEFEETLDEQNVFLAGSEFATEEAGYLEGALSAASNAVALIVKKS